MKLSAPRHVPDELRELIETSTADFEKILRGELGAFAAMVNVTQWGEKYREECTKVVLRAYEKGQAAQ